MGWSFTRQSREQLIRELIQSRENEHARSEVIDYTLCDNVLWYVVRVIAKDAPYLGLDPGDSMNFIRCELLQGSGEGWGHKPLDEAMHPYYYSCPLGYLDMAHVRCAPWRELVRAYHQEPGHRSSPADRPAG